LGTREVPERTYYERAGVHVSERWFATPHGRYAISELSRLRAGRGARSPAARLAGVLAVLLVGVAVTGFAANYRTPLTGMGIAAVALAAAGLAAALRGLERRPYELWAGIHGGTVLLYWSFDEKEYGHVTRALIRAREAQPRDEEHDLVALPSAA
jgi:hypothetical protein